jgi:hypothetical protein
MPARESSIDLGRQAPQDGIRYLGGSVADAADVTAASPSSMPGHRPTCWSTTRVSSVSTRPPDGLAD